MSGLKRQLGQNKTTLLPPRTTDFAAPDRKSLRPDHSGALGNQALQYRMRLNAPDDAYEQEADRVAQQVTTMSDQQVQRRLEDGQAIQAKPLAATITPVIQRQEVEEPEEETAQAKRLIQRQEEAPEKEEEALQTKSLIQRQEEAPEEEEETVQAKDLVQRQEETPQEEEETVQAKALIQRQEEAPEEEEETMQAKGLVQRQEEAPQEEEETIQAQGTPDSSSVSADTANRIQRMQQGGRPLDAATRDYFEPRFGADFSGVRVHDDAEAARVARDVNAQAFTQGSHIFFGSGQCQPENSPGRQLLAHELTHTVQQGAGGAAGSQAKQTGNRSPGFERGLIQRTNGNQPRGGGQVADDANTDATQFGHDKGKLEGEGTDDARIVFDQIGIPGFKRLDPRGAQYSSFSPLRRTKGYTRGNPDQRQVWKDGLDTGTIESKLREKTGPVDPEARNQVFKLDARGRQPLYYFGPLSDIAKELTTPSWGGRGDRPVYKDFHVDHIVELQLGNWDRRAGAANTLANMELLEARKNMASGRQIKNAINEKVQQFNRDTRNRYGTSVASIKRQFHLDFLGTGVGKGDSDIRRNDYWTKEEITRGDHLDALQPSNLEGLGGSGQVRIFSSPVGGGQGKGFRWPRASLNRKERQWLKPLEITGKHFITENEDGSPGVENNPAFGQFDVRFPETDTWEAKEDLDPVPIARVLGARYAGAIDKQMVLARLRRGRVKKVSPIQINAYDITGEGIQVTGKIVTDIPLLRGADIDFSISNGELVLSKTFDTGEFNMPAPIDVRSSELTISVGTRSGIGVSGRVDFGIERLGDGFLEAAARSRGGFSLGGGFDFDSNLFDPARIRMRYENNQFSGEGELGIPSGKIKGIRSANFNVSYAEGRLSATGAAQISAPGIREASLSLEYSEQEGLTIGGSLALADNIPGIRSGSIEARVTRKPDGQYKVFASGRAVPAIPGIDSEISVTYDDGAFMVMGTANYSRGMLSGSVTVGAANSPIGEDNRPTGEPDGRLRAFGSGTVTVQLTPWLQGTVGVRFLPNGELELSGEIGLPSALELFPEKRVEKNIFTINIDIPIVGVAVLGQRIGIFATIGGGLDVHAGVGPGQLRELNLGITYNPDREQETHVTGSAQLHIPASAGLRLFVRGGLGAGIPIVSATAGLEVSGELGIEGAVQANVNVDWTPTRGLVLDARAQAYAEPVLRLSVDAYVEVTADLFLGTVDLYSNRWNLAGVEYGSGMRFGIALPIHYEEGQPFDISLDDVQFTVPRVNARDVIKNALDL